MIFTIMREGPTENKHDANRAMSLQKQRINGR